MSSRFERCAVAVLAGVVFAGLTTYSGASAETGGCGLIGTVGTPELGADDTTAGLESLPVANIALPEQIYFRTSAESFNRRWSFAARDGSSSGPRPRIGADSPKRPTCFVPTDQPLAGNPLRNTADDRSIDDSIQPSPYSYAGRAGSRTASVENFDVSNTPTLRIDFGDGAHLGLILHTVDGFRQLPRQQGISTRARRFDGTIEVPAEILGSPAAQPDSVRQFLASALGGRRFTDTAVDVTVSEFRIDGLGVVLVRARPGPPARLP